MELKTLKDIDPEACCHGIRAPDLKREAINWINHYQTLEHMECESGLDCTREIQWIMHFFDLTEDDL